jgi:hypothetical protein
MAIGTEHGGDLQFDPLLQAVAGQLGNQLTGCAAIEKRVAPLRVV